MKNLSVVLVLLGTILMAAAFLYPRMVKTESLWSEKQARERTEVGYAVHNLAHTHSQASSHAAAIDKHKEEVQKNASSAEFVGEFRLGEVAEVVI